MSSSCFWPLAVGIIGYCCHVSSTIDGIISSCNGNPGSHFLCNTSCRSIENCIANTIKVCLLVSYHLWVNQEPNLLIVTDFGKWFLSVCHYTASFTFQVQRSCIADVGFVKNGALCGKLCGNYYMNICLWAKQIGYLRNHPPLCIINIPCISLLTGLRKYLLAKIKFSAQYYLLIISSNVGLMLSTVIIQFFDRWLFTNLPCV